MTRKNGLYEAGLQAMQSMMHHLTGCVTPSSVRSTTGRLRVAPVLVAAMLMGGAVFAQTGSSLTVINLPSAVSGGSIVTVELHVEFSVDAGYSGDGAIRVEATLGGGGSLLDNYAGYFSRGIRHGVGCPLIEWIENRKVIQL